MHGSLTPPAAPPPRGNPAIVLIALREMRAGLRGFVVFILCIALGVGTIAGVSSIARSLVEGIASQGRVILGGDATFAFIQREASPAERALIGRGGDVSAIATLRGMAVAPDGAALVEVKAVDALYPTAGTLATEPGLAPAELLAERDGVWGGVADPVLFDRLDLKPGAEVTVGTARIQLRARLVSEPDKIANGIGFGPRLIVSEAALRASGLIQPGSLVRWTYRVALPPGRDRDGDLTAFVEAAKRDAPEAGWDVRTRLNADPRFSQNIGRFSQFLTLVGLTALLVGGVGVGNAVSAFVDRKRDSIATMKSLGATGRTVVAAYLLQVMAMASLGAVIGLGLGAALLFGAAASAGAVMPIPIVPTLAPADLALAALYGLLTALTFAILPLGRAHDITVAGLFRDRISPTRGWPRAGYLVVAGLSGLALVALAVGAAQDRKIALIFIGSAILAFGLLRVVAALLMRAARAMPHLRNASVRLAVANLHRPGALTPSLVLSLGLGITLLVTIAAIDGSLTREIRRTLPERAPSFFFIDVPSTRSAEFSAFLRESAPTGAIEEVPMMRGRITALKGIPVASVRASQDAAWVLDGDRGITYAAAVPEGSSVEAGQWWATDYAGPPLVSFDGEMARGLGIGVGDEVTVNVLGRTMTARVANLRKVDWRRLGINFVMVFSPGTFRGAPHTELLTITLPPDADRAIEPGLMRAAARRFPNVTSVRVKDALDAFQEIVAQLVLAIRIASSVALASSVLVLAGALASGHRARLYDAVVLKTLGATRRPLLLAYLVEYGALGLATALFGLAAGSLAAWVVVSRVMHLGFAPSLGTTVAWAAAAVLVAVGIGLAGTWRILGHKPAPYLRTL